MCVCVCACVCCGLLCNILWYGGEFFLLKHRAKAVATQAASLSLDMCVHRDKAVATQAASVSLDVFVHRAKAVATQAASMSLDMIIHPGLTVQYNKILHNNTESSTDGRTDRHTAQQQSTAITPTV